MNLRKKVAIITGGSRGIGKAIAKKFIENGASLLLIALHEKGLDNVKKDLSKVGNNVDILNGDISDPAFSKKIIERAIYKFGTVDILVNNAGIITRTPTEDLSLKEWHRVIDVNLNGTFYLCQAVLPIMCNNKYGKIINLTSQMARIPHPNASPSYEVSKAGIAALTRHLAYHYAKYNVYVNSIAPGSIATDLAKSMSNEAREKLKKSILLGRLGKPEEVGSLALFLASDSSNYITGATINISGGSLMD